MSGFGSDDIASIFKDQIRMTETINAIKQIENAVIRIADKIGVVSTTANDGVKKTLDGAKGVESSLAASSEQMIDLREVSEQMFNDWDVRLQRIKGVFDSFLSTTQNVGTELRKLGADPSGEINSLLGQIPIYGPMLQIALASAAQNAAYAQTGRQSAMAFMGGEALTPDWIRNAGTGIGANAKSLYEGKLGESGDLLKVYDTLAKGGFKLSEALRPGVQEVKAFGDTIASSTLGIDAAFNMSAGSTAKFASELSAMSRGSLRESVELTARLGAEAHQTAMESQTFIGTILQLTSALRMQGGEASQVGDIFVNMSRAIGGVLGLDASKSLHVADLAKGATAGFTGWTQNLDEGARMLLAEKAARLIYGEKHGLSPTDIMISSKFGFTNMNSINPNFESATSGQFQTAMLQALLVELKYGSGHVTSDQAVKMQKVFGWKDEMLLAVLGMSGTSPENLVGQILKQIKVDTTSAETAAEFNKPLNRNAMTEIMNDVKNLMLSIGNMTIALLTGLVQVTVGGFMSLVYLDSSYLSGAVSLAGKGLVKSVGAVADRAKQLGLDTFLQIDPTQFDPNAFLREANTETPEQLAEQRRASKALATQAKKVQAALARESPVSDNDRTVKTHAWSDGSPRGFNAKNYKFSLHVEELPNKDVDGRPGSK